MKLIMVVDDMAIFREPIAASLRCEGYQTVCAAHGAEALQLIQRERPDLILMDVAMPVMDGLTCLQALRADPALQDIAVIMLSAMSEREAVVQAVQLGARGYLLKSQFSLADLLARVRESTDLFDAGCALTPDVLRSHPPRAPVDLAAAPLPASVCPPAASGALNATATLERIRRGLQLRPLPTVLQQVLRLAQARSGSFDEVANAVRKDHALSLKVLRVANSGFFGTGKKVHNLAEATQRIGAAGVRNAVAAILLIEHFDGAEVGGLHLQRFWEHALATALLSDLTGRAVDAPGAEQLFLAGLLHDLGRLLLSTTFPQPYTGVLERGAESGEDLRAFEHATFGVTHDLVTQDVLTNWEVPHDLLDAAGHHALPGEDPLRTPSCTPIRLIVGFADRLAHALLLGDSGNSLALPWREHAQALNLGAPAVLALAHAGVTQAIDAELFYTAPGREPVGRPLALELADEYAPTPQAVCLGGDDDPLTLFFTQLGWLHPRRPRMAILPVDSARDLRRRFVELETLEQRLARRLAVLVTSAGASVTPPAELLDGREGGIAPMPGRYEDLMLAVAALAGSASRTLSGAE